MLIFDNPVLCLGLIKYHVGVGGRANPMLCLELIQQSHIGGGGASKLMFFSCSKTTVYQI